MSNEGGRPPLIRHRDEESLGVENGEQNVRDSGVRGGGKDKTGRWTTSGASARRRGGVIVILSDCPPAGHQIRGCKHRHLGGAWTVKERTRQLIRLDDDRRPYRRPVIEPGRRLHRHLHTAMR